MFRQKKQVLTCIVLLIGTIGIAAFIFPKPPSEIEKPNKGVVTMATNQIMIDPKIDLTSDQEITILIHFRTKPARAAVEWAKTQGIPLTLEQAEQDVKESHQRFQADIKKYLDSEQITYAVTHTYTAAFNGVAMRLRATDIKALLQSAEIEAIYANKQMNMIPPVKPS